jgi:hypothetical protein
MPDDYKTHQQEDSHYVHGRVMPDDYELKKSAKRHIFFTGLIVPGKTYPYKDTLANMEKMLDKIPEGGKDIFDRFYKPLTNFISALHVSVGWKFDDKDAPETQFLTGIADIIRELAPTDKMTKQTSSTEGRHIFFTGLIIPGQKYAYKETLTHLETLLKDIPEGGQNTFTDFYEPLKTFIGAFHVSVGWKFNDKNAPETQFLMGIMDLIKELSPVAYKK